MYYQLQDEEEYKATMCPDCDERPKDIGEVDCKFCARKKMTGGRFTNVTKPLHKMLDIMESVDVIR